MKATLPGVRRPGASFGPTKLIGADLRRQPLAPARRGHLVVVKFRDSAAEPWVKLGVGYEALLLLEPGATKEQVQRAFEERSKSRLQVRRAGVHF